jgi:hypothetical protein
VRSTAITPAGQIGYDFTSSHQGGGDRREATAYLYQLICTLVAIAHHRIVHSVSSDRSKHTLQTRRDRKKVKRSCPSGRRIQNGVGSCEKTFSGCEETYRHLPYPMPTCRSSQRPLGGRPPGGRNTCSRKPSEYLSETTVREGPASDELSLNADANYLCGDRRPQSVFARTCTDELAQFHHRLYYE